MVMISFVSYEFCKLKIYMLFKFNKDNIIILFIFSCNLLKITYLWAKPDLSRNLINSTWLWPVWHVYSLIYNAQIEMQGKAFLEQLPAVYVQLTKFTQKKDLLLVVNCEFVLLHVTFVQKNVWLLIFQWNRFLFPHKEKYCISP